MGFYAACLNTPSNGIVTSTLGGRERAAPTAPATATYEPSLAVVAQGREREADLGRATFIFDESRYLLTSLDMPVISQVIEASEKKPYVCFLLKLEIPLVHELLSREEIRPPEVPSVSPAMATSETTPDLLDACCRCVELLSTPKATKPRSCLHTGGVVEWTITVIQ